jgi:hypothetical protein
VLGIQVDDLSKLGNLRYVAFGPPRGHSPQCFFLRTTADAGVWHYRWAGLPPDCEMKVQSYIQSGDSKDSTE